MKLLHVIVATILLLVGCATTANYEAILSTWVGQSADNLVMSWGPPRSSYQLSNGGRVLEYDNQRNMQIGGYTYTTPQTTYQYGNASIYGNGRTVNGTYTGTSTTYVQQQSPIYNIPLTCTTRFSVNPSGVITSWTWQGNNCKSMK